MAKGVEKLCEGAWLEVGLGRPGWFMSGSGGCVRKRWVRGDIGPEVPGRPEHTHKHTHTQLNGQRSADLKRVVREGRRRAACGCVGVSSLRVSGWSGQKLHD